MQEGSAPGPLPTAPSALAQGPPSSPLTFDLAAERHAGRSDRQQHQIHLLVLLGLGLGLAVLGGTATASARGGPPLAVFVGIALAGVGLAGAGFAGYRAVARRAPTRLVVDHEGLRFGLVDGRALTLRWSDPRLKVDVRQLIADYEPLLPEADARRFHPQWVRVMGARGSAPLVETTVPSEAVPAIIGAAERGGVLVRTVAVAFYWRPMTPGSGVLRYEVEGKPHRAHAVNGIIARLRGRRSGPDPVA